MIVKSNMCAIPTELVIYVITVVACKFYDLKQRQMKNMYKKACSMTTELYCLTLQTKNFQIICATILCDSYVIYFAKVPFNRGLAHVYNWD